MVYIHWLHTQDLEFISFCSVLQQSFCFPVLVYCRRHNNRSYIEKQLLNAVDEMEQYIKTYPDFPVPACYAHPVVLKRMQDILKEGRAETIPAALRVLKEDLKALNSSVVVEQEEYDEIVAIKPMFLVMDYR